ncbi:cytosolic oligopeptidase A [Populus alba x Populus x berolinensis]|nr:cytosolic oligopeptidase A [Populus alba x Populus x berolinensis]
MPTRHKRENENKNNKTICTLHTIQHMAETRKVHPVGAVLLIINLLMASRISLSRSILLLQRTNNHFPYSHFTPKRFPKSYPCPLWSSSFSLCLQTLHKSSTTTATTPPSISNCYSSISMDPVVDEANPLLQDFEFPPFDVVEAKHVRPGIRALLKNLESDLEELERTVEPSWPKLVEPLEKIADQLTVVWGMINHLKAVKDSPELRAAIEEVQPEKVKFQLRLGQSKPIYNAFKAIQDSPQWSSLSDARKRIVESQIKEGVLNGVALDDDKREQFNKIEQELERLSQKFGENVLDATKKFEKIITDKKDIEGLPATSLGLAAQTAVSKGHTDASAENGPWIITLDAPSFMSVMQHARNRGLREEIYRAYVTRASSGDLNNTAIIDEILELRLEKAKLLGYNNYTEVSMATKMATVEKAEELLEKLRAASWNAAVQDMEDLKIFSKSQGAMEANDLTHWDTGFWAERLRESKYDINEEELRPFFSLPKVMDGLFNLAKTIFGIDIEPADGLAPVWNNDVKFYCVKDSLDSPIAYFYFDPYSRPSEKRGGAWMDEVVSRSCVLSPNGTAPRLPIAHMVCNQTPPVGDKPSLMTFREVETVFHEFGHALQHMLTKQDEGLVAGIRGIEWDAVELPSQFMENWCYHRETLMGIAKHYETGESLPEEVYLKLLAARTFRAGSFSLRQIKFASLDLELHTKYIPGALESIYDVDQRVSKRTQVIPPLPEDRFLCGFSHIFAGGYAAGYYSYKWAEVLSADAFSAFEDAGLDNHKAVKETGHKFRETILALGGGKAPLEVFVEFRGREPSPEALLRHNGLLSVTTSA